MLALTALAGALLAAACGGGGVLDGTRWELTTLDGEDALSEPAAWLRFGEGGRLSGSTGCNSLGGTWRSSDSELSFDEISMTLIGCPGEVGEQEAAFNRALRETTSYSVVGRTLSLRDDAGSVRMIFRRSSDGSPSP